MASPYYQEYYKVIQKSNEPLGSGFTGKEILSKDEFNVILDLEDETRRGSNYSCIFPLKETAGKYYGLTEVKRYQNALYCAWLCSSWEVKSKMIRNNEKKSK